MAEGESVEGLFRARTLKQGLILIVIIALIPFAVVSGLQGAAVLDGTRTLLAGRLAGVASNIAERERDPFIVARHTLTTMSALPEVRAASPGCNGVLKAAVNEQLGVISFYRTNTAGILKCASLPYAEGQQVSDMVWWRKGVGSDDMSVSKPMIGQLTKRPVIAVMLPLKANGAQDGAIAAAISLEGVQRSINRAVRNSDGVAAILSEDGEVLLSTSKLRFGKIDVSGKTGPLAILKAEDKSEWAYAVAPLERRDLFVLYAEPSEKIMTPNVRQLQLSLLLPLLAMLFASLAIWFGTDRWVVSWLHRLRALANQFSGGNFAGNERAFIKAPDEVAELSNDLHSMARAIQARDNELMTALAVKTELTREVHHRVKNNLQIVMSLLTLQASRLDESDTHEMLAQTRARIGALALIHRLLYQQEENETPNEVSIDNLLVELCKQLRTANRVHDRIELKCAIASHAIEIDHAVPLALFTVEAVTNAYRHAFDDEQSGSITLGFSISDKVATLMISDDGSGYMMDNMDGRMGTDLMNAFADQVGGSAAVQSAPGQGTKVILRFPAQNSRLA